MAKNPYLKDYEDFYKWLIKRDQELSPEVKKAARRFLNALWCAAHNDKPPIGFVDEIKKFERAKARVGNLQN